MRKAQLANVKDHELIEAKSRLEGAAPERKETKGKRGKTLRRNNSCAQVMVKVLTFGQKGQLLEKVSDTEWSVQIGILKMKVKESDMEYINTLEANREKSSCNSKGRDYHVSLELDPSWRTI